METISSIDLDLLVINLLLLVGNILSGSDKFDVFGIGLVSLSLESSKSISNLGSIVNCGMMGNTGSNCQIICTLSSNLLSINFENLSSGGISPGLL